MLFPENAVKMDEIRDIELVAPEEAGDRWMGLEHIDLVRTIRKYVTDNADTLTLVGKRYSVTGPDDAAITACLDFQVPHLKKVTPTGYNFSLGFLSRNDRRRALTFYYGVTAKDKSHGLCFGLVDTKKHTTGTDINAVVEDVFSLWTHCVAGIEDHADGLKAEFLTERQVDHALMQACRGKRNERFRWSKLGLVDEALARIEPQPKNRTSWKLLLAFAEVVKQCPDIWQMDMGLHFVDLLPVRKLVRK